VKLSFNVPSSLSTGSHTFTLKAYDSDQNKQGGDCGVASWKLNVNGPPPNNPPNNPPANPPANTLYNNSADGTRSGNGFAYRIYLPDRGTEEEAVPGEPGRVEESSGCGRLADQRVVVRCHLVQAGPAVRDAHVEQRGRAVLDRLGQPGQPPVVPLEPEPRALVRVGHPEQDPRALTVQVERGGEVDRHRHLRTPQCAGGVRVLVAAVVKGHGPQLHEQTTGVAHVGDVFLEAARGAHRAELAI